MISFSVKGSGIKEIFRKRLGAIVINNLIYHFGKVYSNTFYIFVRTIWM